MNGGGVRTILIVSTATGYGGAERSMELLAPELARASRVVVMTGNPRHRRNLLAAAVRAGTADRLRVWSMPFDEGRRGTAGSVARFVAARLWLRPDVVLTNTERSACVAAWGARFLPGASADIWIYVRDFMWRDLAGVLGRLPRAGVLVSGPAVLERPGYLEALVEPKTAKRLRIVPCMVDAAPFSASVMAPGSYVLHLATVNPLKGHVHLINAAARLLADGRRVPVRSRGVTDSAALRRELEERIGRAGLAGAGGFELLDHAEDPTEDFRGCFCVVVTTVSHSGGPETLGRTIIEAWSHGRPVVAFAAGGPKHLISHGEDGLLVEEGDERGLAEALWRLQTEPGLAARLGARGREKALHDHHPRVVTERLQAVFAEAGPRG